jgi:Na+-transporting methylmalonyl-CoA/oxaloacetate decarboxylase gamma subunit
MDNPWMIMFAGVGTVFTALILIIVMLMLFRIIFNERKAKKTATPASTAGTSGSAQAAVSVPASAPVQVQPAAADGAELVAVITAAIAAATGLSPSGFRVASIQANAESGGGFNTPVWGRVERFNRS